MPHISSVAHLIVGSSPFHLALGIELLSASKGDVVIVEADDRPGGAWRVGEVFGIPDLELGCHVLDNDPEGYALLERCGVDLPVMHPRPTLIVTRPTGATGPDLVKNCAVFGYGTLRRNRTFDRARHDSLVRTLRTRTRTTVVPWRYPSLGCAGLVRDLAGRFTDLGGQLLTGLRVAALDERDDRVVCTLSDENAIDAEHVHVSTNSNDIRLDGLTTTPISARTSVLIALAGAPRPFSMVQVKGEPVVHVVSNIGRYASAPAGTVVLAVQLHRRASEEAGTVERRLRRLGLLRDSDVVTGFHTERYRVAGREAVAAWTRATASSTRISARHPAALVQSLGELARTADRRVMA